MGRYGTVTYGALAKASFLLGLGLFVLGSIGEFIGHAYLGGLPPWEDTVIFGTEVAGTVTGFFSPFVFGIFLPLTE